MSRMLIVVATYPIRPCCECTVSVRFWRKERASRMKNIQVIPPSWGWHKVALYFYLYFYCNITNFRDKDNSPELV